MRFRATLNLRKFKVALNPSVELFKTLPNDASCIADQNLITKNRGPELVFKLLAVKAKIKDVFRRLYSCDGNLLSHKNDNNVFTNHWAFVCTMIVTSTDINK